MKQRKRSVLFEWAVSYLIILAIPLFTILLNYKLNIDTIRAEIWDVNQIVLKNLENEIDQIMSEQESIYNYFYGDDFFNNWVSHETKTPEFYYDSWKLMHQIDARCKYSPNIRCLMYMVDESYIVHNSAANNARHIYLALNQNYTYPGYEEWIALLSEEYNNEFLFTRYVNAKDDKKCLVYADTVEQNGNKRVNIFISVTLDEITDMAVNEKLRGHTVMVCGDEAELLGNDEDILSDELKELIFSGAESFETKEYMGIVKPSIYKNLSFCVLIAQKEFWEQATRIRDLFLMSTVITLVVAFGMVGFLLRRNFQPVSHLVKKIGSERTLGNEFYQIELAYNRMKNENKSMKQIIQGQKNALKGSYLLSAMKGRKRNLSKNEMDFFELEEGKPVMLCGILATGEDDLLRFAIDNVFMELMEGEDVCSIEDGSYLLYLFFAEPEKKEGLERRYEEQMNYMCEFFRERWNVNLECRKTDWEEGLNRAEVLYQKLMDAYTEKEEGQIQNRNLGGEVRRIVSDILEYVEENYSDSGLNISSIADFIDKNPKYISRVFKEEMGEGILDYVNRIRITKAKEIIATRRYSAEEAGKMVGYASNQTFRRAFTKIVGMPPGKYGDSLQNIERE